MRYFLSLLLAVLLFAGASAFGQSTFGTFVGTVQDQSGSVIGAAVVTITNLDDNSTRSATTNSSGQYQLLNLPPGRYSIAVVKPGFANAKVDQVTLDARQERRVDVTLALASVQQSVQVSAEAAAINTENATIANTMGSEEVTGLPSNYRGASTSPLGAIVASANVSQDQFGNISLTGSQPFQTDYTVDGTSTVNIVYNSPASNMYPSSEMLSEFKVSAINNNAEFATTGDVTVTTKSGGNAFHGSAFEYLQNRALDATVYGATQKQAKVWNTFGGSLSGPVIIPKLYNGHDKTFFFIDSELNRRPGTQLIVDNVPTAAMVAGNLNGVPGPPAIDPFTGAPFPNNTIPACTSSGQLDCLNPVTQRLLTKYIPLPNYNSGSTIGNYRTQQPLSNETNGYDIRVDQYIGKNNQLFGRWTWKNLPQQFEPNSGFGGGAFQTQLAQLLPPISNNEYDKNLIISDNHLITPHLVNEFRFGYSRLNITSSFSLQGAAVVKDLGLVGLDLSHAGTLGGFPGFDFSSGTGFTNIGHDAIGPTASKTTQYGDNLSWIRGKHSMKFGGEFRRVEYARIDNFGASDEFGSFSFNGGFSGNSFADLLLGLPATDQVFVTGPPLDQRSTHFAIFGQDEWHATRSLTVSFGLRWELQPPFNEINGNIANFNPKTGGIIVPDVAYQKLPPAPGVLFTFNSCSINPLPNPDLPCTPFESASQAHIPQGLRYTYYRNFDPRIGVAWRPFGNDKTVFRAGFGIFTVPSLGWVAYMMTGVAATNPPFYVNGLDNNNKPLFVLPSVGYGNGGFVPEIVGTGNVFEAQDMHYRDPQSAQWNVTIERQFLNTWTARGSYIGENSYRLSVNVDLNQCHSSPNGPCIKPFPQFNDIISMKNYGFANYQALELQLSHRMAQGFYLQATYDWTKDLSNLGDAPVGSGTEAGNFSGSYFIDDQFNLRNNRGNDPGPRRQRFLATGLYQLPFGQGRPFLSNANRFVNGALGGWQLSAIILAQTGPFMTAVDSNPADSASNLNELGRFLSIRPDQIGPCDLSNPSPSGWFNLNGFTLTPQGAGRTGNAGVGTCVGPGTTTVSAGLAKNFQIWERLRMRFEATYTNLLNHPNFLQPQSMDISSPGTFGVTQTVQGAENGGNRVGQLSLRLDF
ncbi:MAG TPA: TonB-dependent receptor [Bryobacteraceae bacterium]|nr:TonB-dependent receptor [Bryobacteraceae bacterium]